MQTEGKIKYLKRNKKHEDQLWIIACSYAYPYFFSKILKTQTKMRFPASVKHYIINLEFWNFPFCWNKFPTRARTNRNSLHLTFVYVSAVLNFVSAIRSGTYQLLPHIFLSSCFHWTLFFSCTNLTVLIMFKPAHVLVALNGLGIQFFGTQGKQNTTAQQQGKLN